MALDPSIALGVKLPQIEGPAQQYQNMLALQNAQRQLQQQDMQMQNMLRQRQEVDETRRILSESGGDFGKASNALLQRGFLAPAVQVQQMADLGQQRNAAAQETQQKALASKIKNLREFLPAIQDQAGYSAWRDAAIKEIPQFVQFIPEQFSTDNIQRLALGADDLIKRFTVGNTLMDSTGRVVGTATPLPRQANPAADLLIPNEAGQLIPNAPLIEARRQIAAAGRAPAQSPAMANMPKLKQGERWNPELQRVEAVPGSDIYLKQRGAHGKDLGALQAVDTKTETAVQKIDELLKPENKDGFNANFGGYNAYLTRMVPGDKTQNTRKLIDSIKSDLKAAGLEVMRQGGSIGQMTVQEWPIVEQMVAAIDPVLGEENARQQFLNVKNYLNSIRTKAREKYDTEWGDSQYSRSGNDSDPLGLRKK